MTMNSCIAILLINESLVFGWWGFLFSTFDFDHSDLTLIAFRIVDNTGPGEGLSHSIRGLQESGTCSHERKIEQPTKSQNEVRILESDVLAVNWPTKCTMHISRRRVFYLIVIFFPLFIRNSEQSRAEPNAIISILLSCISSNISFTLDFFFILSSSNISFPNCLFVKNIYRSESLPMENFVFIMSP